MTTDYFTDSGDPSPYLKRIADAGFSHVHWCHEWDSDVLYAQADIEQIARWLREYGLRLLDLHGSAGKLKRWTSLMELERRQGVQLVMNRVEMTARLGSDVTILHAGTAQELPALRKSLDELAQFAGQHGVRIAIENGDFRTIQTLLDEYERDYVGLCYDSGHGNMHPHGLSSLAALKHRLIAIHLHDNNGNDDQHRPVFSGTIDWEKLARLLADCSYDKCVSLEVTMADTSYQNEEKFLTDAFVDGLRLTRMIERYRVS